MNWRRYKKGSFLFLLLFIFGYQVGEAQLLKRALQRGANRAVEKKVEKEAEKQTGKLLDSLFKSKNGDEVNGGNDSVSTENRRKGMKMMQEMLGGMNTADLPPSFSFDTRVIWESEDEKGRVTEMYMFFEPDGSNFGMSPEPFKEKDFETFTVMNFESEYIAVFSQSDEEKQVMTVPFMTETMQGYMKEKQEDPEYNIEKTGNSKEISGYNCDEYIVTTEEYIQNVWITEEVDVTNGLQSFFQQTFAENKRMGMPQISKGFPMEVEMINRKNDKKSYLRTKSIDSQNLTLKTSDYNTMDMGQ